MTERERDLRQYVSGLVFAVVLTALPFTLVWTGWLGRPETIGVIIVAAFVQIVVHVRFFLHIDLSRQRREDLQVLLFTILLLALMGIGTLWVLTDLAERMH